MDSAASFLSVLAAHPATLSLVAASSLMLLLEQRRLVLLPLLIQYLLLGLLAGPQLYPPIMFVRVGLGVAVCLILYITAGHVQGELHALPYPSGEEERIWHARLISSLSANELSSIKPSFRLALVALGGLTAYGAWRAQPVPGISVEMSLTAYWLMSVGLFMAITATEPLRVGFGLLTFLNGFESIYLSLEQSLLMIALLGLVDLGISLGIVVCAESWLESLRREAPE